MQEGLLQAALSALRQGEGNEEPLVFEPPLMTALKTAIGEADRAGVLVEAVAQLVAFAYFLKEKRRSPEAADRLLAAVTERVLGPLRALGGTAAYIVTTLEDEARRASLLGIEQPAFQPAEAPAGGQVRAGPLARFVAARAGQDDD